MTTSEFDDVKARLARIENKRRLTDSKDTKRPSLRRASTDPNDPTGDNPLRAAMTGPRCTGAKTSRTSRSGHRTMPDRILPGPAFFGLRLRCSRPRLYLSGFTVIVNPSSRVSVGRKPFILGELTGPTPLRRGMNVGKGANEAHCVFKDTELNQWDRQDVAGYGAVFPQVRYYA